MKAPTKLGIWITYQHANPIEFNGKTIQLNHILFGANTNPLQIQFLSLYTLIQQYEEIVLFGPDNAKIDLYTLLCDYTMLSDRKIEIRSTNGELTENQKHNFVKNHFNPPAYMPKNTCVNTQVF